MITTIILGVLNAVLMTALLIYVLRMKRQQAKKEQLHIERMERVQLKYDRLFEDMSVNIQKLKDAHNALPCARTDKKDEKESDQSVKGVHIVRVRGEGINLNDLLKKMIFGQMAEENTPFHAYVKVRAQLENDRKSMTRFSFQNYIEALDKDGLDCILEWLNEQEDYEFSSIVRDEIAHRKTQKTKK